MLGVCKSVFAFKRDLRWLRPVTHILKILAALLLVLLNHGWALWLFVIMTTFIIFVLSLLWLNRLLILGIDFVDSWK